MNECRLVISDKLWEKIASLLPDNDGEPGATESDTRIFLKAVVEPSLEKFGKWNTVFKRLRRRVKTGGGSLFNAASGELDPEYAPGIRCCRCNNCSSSPKGIRDKKGAQNQTVGCSRGGLTTKIGTLVYAYGNPARVLLVPGQVYDMIRCCPFDWRHSL